MRFTCNPVGAQADLLSGEGWDIGSLLQQTVITPSCGTGSLSPELATKVLQLTKECLSCTKNKISEVENRQLTD